jgi:hypothetical protein
MSNPNLDLYNISSENNLTELLAHFDSGFVLDIIEDKINMRQYNSMPESNIVKSFEENFKYMHEKFPGDGENINLVRTNVYTEVIDILCRGFNLNYALDDSTDLYSAAYYLYDFLVCNFGSTLVNFFTSFIVNNKNSLYNALNLDAYKKNKDSSTIYNKKIYVDPKYVTINANLETVLRYIVTIDITLDNIIQTTYINPQVVLFLSEIITDKGDYFKDYYCSLLNKPDVLPVILTDIRLQLQKMNTDNSAIIDDYISKEEEKNAENKS